MDIIILDEGQPGSATVLASTTNARELKEIVKPALEGLVASGDSDASGMVTDYVNTDDLDPDFFLWLIYRDSQGRQLSPGIKLSQIASMESRNSLIWKSRFSSGASIDRADIVALIAKGHTIFGPAKFSLDHSGDPEGFFEITLAGNLSFSVLRTSEYEDEILALLPEDEVGPRMVQDAWQILIPAIRNAYLNDKVWRTTGRAKFVTDCKNTMHSI